MKLKVEDLDSEHCVIGIASGKSKAAKRDLPMTHAVYQALKVWLKQSGSGSGWLFPSPLKAGRSYDQKRVFDWDHAALEASGVSDRRLGNDIGKILSGCNAQILEQTLHVYANRSVMLIN